MTSVVGYFTSIIATVLIGVVISELIKEQQLRVIVQMIMGVLLLLVVLRPINAISPEKIVYEAGEWLSDEIQIKDYETLYQDKLRNQVKTLTEEYIRRKAESINASIWVRVELNEEGYPTPNAVLIGGILSWEQRQILSEYISSAFGIPLDKQRWELYDS